MLIFNKFIIAIAFVVEYCGYLRNTPTPLHSIPQELFLLFMCYFIHWHFKRSDSAIYLKVLSTAPFWIHLIRIAIYNEKLLEIPKKFQLLGGVSILSYLSKYTVPLEPLVRIFITFKTFNIIGFNPIIDLPIIMSHIYNSTGGHIEHAGRYT